MLVKSTREKPAVMVDRTSFIAWIEGVLLDRRGNSVVVGDSVDNEKTEELLEKGEVIGLLNNGKWVSTIAKEHNRFVEKKVK